MYIVIAIRLEQFFAIYSVNMALRDKDNILNDHNMKSKYVYSDFHCDFYFEVITKVAYQEHNNTLQQEAH